MDILAKPEYRRLLDHISWFNNHDFIHTNTIEYIDAEKAAVLPFAEEGQVLLSFRDIGTLAVIDLDSEEIVWARRGDWAGQHDPDIPRSEEHTSELQSLMRISYAVFCLKK